ncbi:MAG: hypothetical protein ACN4E2_01215 [Nitrospinota bacterium]
MRKFIVALSMMMLLFGATTTLASDLESFIELPLFINGGLADNAIDKPKPVNPTPKDKWPSIQEESVTEAAPVEVAPVPVVLAPEEEAQEEEVPLPPAPLPQTEAVTTPTPTPKKVSIPSPEIREEIPLQNDSNITKDEERLIPIIDAATLFKAGYVDDSFDYIARVVDTEDKAPVMHGAYKGILYINIGEKDGVQIDDKFTIIKKGKKVRKPGITGLFRPSYGRKVMIAGIIQVVDTEKNISKCQVIGVFQPINLKDYVIEYVKPVPPKIDPDKPILDKDISATIVASRSGAEYLSYGDIIYLNVGQNKNVEPGDVFNLINEDDEILNSSRLAKALPKVKAKALVISTRRKSSTAFITTSLHPVSVGTFAKFALEH